MTYKFEQFKVEITDPTIQINVDSLAVQPTQMTMSIDIVLVTDSARFGVNLTNIPINTLEFQGYGQLEERVLHKLQEYAI